MNNRFSTKKLCFIALFTAMNIGLSSFGVPVPGGHLYLNDIVICFSALIFDPLSAFIIGGIGAFIGDFLFYPAPMFVSLITHGLQAVLISVLYRSVKTIPRGAMAVLSLFIGAVIMVVGYSIGRAYIYGTPEYAIVKLPYQIAQAVVGALCGWVLYFKSPLKKYITEIPQK